MNKIIFVLLVFLVGGPLAGYNANAQEKPNRDFKLESEALRQDYKSMEKDWSQQKASFQKKLENFLKKVETHISELKATLDYGDENVRNKINEELADFGRIRDNVKQMIHEITAATVTKLSGIKGDVANFMEDLQD